MTAVVERPGVPQALPVLPPGPWISHGRIFDYEYWRERDRFRELDDMIARRVHRWARKAA